MFTPRTWVTSAVLATMGILLRPESLAGQQREAPPGMFRDLDDESVGKAVILRGKQLFIDDELVEELCGGGRVLNQPVKHPGNPVIVPNQPSDGFQFGYGSVLFD